MKGCVVERAKASNTIDLYPLILKAAKDGVFPGSQPSEKALKEYYFKLLMQELPSEFHFYYLAKRGRGYLGFLHAVLIPARWDGAITTFYVDTVYVVEHRRKYGVGKKLLDALIKEAENMGIRDFEFLCPDAQINLWEKKRKAKKISNLMRVTNGSI
jgi:GNAT superfamily N-acetyltransferase